MKTDKEKGQRHFARMLRPIYSGIQLLLQEYKLNWKKNYLTYSRAFTWNKAHANRCFD